MFYLVQFDEYEEEHIEEMVKLIRQNNLTIPFWQRLRKEILITIGRMRRPELLRWSYCAHFDMPKAFEVDCHRECWSNAWQMLRNHINWMDDKSLHTLTPGALKMLVDFWMNLKVIVWQDEGLMYAYGRDHRLRPIIVFNIHQIDPERVKR